MKQEINRQNGMNVVLTTNGAQTNNTGSSSTGSGAQAVREAMREFNVHEDEQFRAMFRVKVNTVAKRVNDAKKGRRALGVVAQGRFRVPGTTHTINVYVCVYERWVVEGDYRAAYHTVAVEAYNHAFSQMGVEMLKKEVNYCYGTFENALKNTINSVVFNYVNAWLEASAKAEESAKAAEETVNETDNDYWDSLVAQTEKYLNDRLEECGMNALKLADALVEAYKNTDGAWHYGEVPTLALWVAYKAKIVSRLESLGDGAQTPAPGLKTAAEKSSEINGSPAPGLQVEELLAIDWDRMDDVDDGEDIGCRVVGNYLLMTTRDCDFDHSYMDVTLRLTAAAERKYVQDAHEAWELTWRVEWDDDVKDVADKVSRAMETAQRTFFRVGSVYTGDNGKVYLLDSVEWDDYRDRYIVTLKYSVTLKDADGEEIDGTMDAAATVVTFYDGDDNVAFHAEDIVELS